MPLATKIFASFFVATSIVSSEPILSSWFTEHSGSYARLYETDADKIALNAVTTWDRGAGVQNEPTYAGIHEVSYTNDWVYIRSTNLAGYIMGPWYGNLARTNLFPNYPAIQADMYRFPRTPTDPTTVTDKTITGGGPIGYMVNGVSMFDSRDAFSYDLGTGDDVQGNTGDGAWNRDAYVNESVTFDAGNAHQAGSNHHYHANPPALRHQLGDSVDFDPATNTYTENFNGEHSPIIAWVRDGIPVYGPYGYSDPLDANSTVRRMISGYQLRTDIAANGSARNSWPAWASRVYSVVFAAGPNVSANYPLGRYLEDKDYKGDLGLTLGVDFDLNEFNTRWCLTPEFPTGTWAYFTCIETDGTPTFPYNIASAYFGSPTGGDVTALPANDDTISPFATLFEGGPEKLETVTAIEVNAPAPNQVTLTWSAAEGGSYQLSDTADLNIDFVPIAPDVLADSDTMEATIDYASALPDQMFYKFTRTDLADFDDTGFDYDRPLPALGEDVTITVTMSGGPMDLSVRPQTLTFNGQSIDVNSANISRTSRTSLSFDALIYGLAPGNYDVAATYPAGPDRTGTYTIAPNILLIIVDDWGTDRSTLDNNEPDAELPNMPHFEELASQGLRFTRAYAQPLCSPTRASLLTGRQPFQHKVGSPDLAAQFSGDSGIDEITLPEILTSEGAPQQMLSVGKWHLGGNNAGYASRGGWTEFYGITGGAASPSYYDWTKNSNGTTATSNTYSVTDSTNEAVTFMLEKTASAQPWFVWVGYNGVHAPFEDPPAELAPVGGYSAQISGEENNDYTYRKMCEALDTEIGRLMENFDPAQTHLILIGDNGTPGAHVQAPFGNGHAKGSIYNGGTNVPMVVTGPAVNVAAGSTTSELVHCVDLFSTILELAGINEAAVLGLNAMEVQSTSIVPILNGTDTLDRTMIAELGGNANDTHARAIITDDYPEYKLIIFGDPDLTTDTPYFEFYDLANDWNEHSPLGQNLNEPYQIDIATLDALGGNVRAAYDAAVAVDTALGGGYSDQPTP
ncbi:sulfatase-like hydrolase/transferase [Coraliomargarita sp. W4R53]